MTARRPLVVVSGDATEIPTGDTIDPAYLPASSSDASFPFFMA